MSCTLTAPEIRLLGSAGFEAPYEVQQLKAGRNNQVFRASDQTGRDVVLKRYFQHAKDSRDRLEHEWRFLDYAEKVAGSFVPRLLGRCEQSRTALIEWKEGEVFAGDPSRDEILAASEFARLLNPKNRDKLAADLPIAADACFTWKDHLSLLQRRLDRLGSITDKGAREFAADELRPVALEVMGCVRGLEDGFKSPLVEQRVISPSDFGYHNALRLSGGNPCFVDFEYAGWDGIGKMVADFFSQPEIPVPLMYLSDFENSLLSGRGDTDREALGRSWAGLLAIHAMKWCCILLNDFLVVGDARREFAGAKRSGGEQLGNAWGYFNKVCVPRWEALAGFRSPLY